MHDVLTIAAIADELSATVLNGRVQRVGMIDARTLGMEIYAGGRRRTLIASADDRRDRLYLSSAEPAFDVAIVTPFLLLLRKYVRGGKIIAIDQPPLERMVRLSIAKRLGPANDAFETGPERVNLPVNLPVVEEDDDDDLEGPEGAIFIHLSIEMMGRHSNLILVDDEGKVMESAKRVTERMSRVRPVMPRRLFIDPPPVNKPDPRRLTAADCDALFASAKPIEPVTNVLVRSLRAVSPQIAREIVHRSTSQADRVVASLQPDDFTALARETRRIFEPLLTSAWSPQLYTDEDGVPQAFAALPFASLADTWTQMPIVSISEAAERFEGGGDATPPVRHAQRRQRLLDQIGSGRSKVQTKLAALQEQLVRGKEAENLRIAGDAIYAWLWQVKQGDTELRLEDGTVVGLDPKLSPKDNAQDYFERYRKAKGASDHVPEMIATVDGQLAYLDQLATMAGLAERFEDLETLQAEWEQFQAATGTKLPAKGRTPKRALQPRRPKALGDDDGNLVYIGRSGPQNDAVTFDLAAPEDSWFHVRGVPGAHVIVKWRNPRGDRNPRTIEAAAALAAFYSSGRSSGLVEVDITDRRHVRKIKGTGPGMVTYRNERTIAVAPKDEQALTDILG